MSHIGTATRCFTDIKTRSALVAYQGKHGLPKTGKLDDATRKALGIQ